MLGYALQPMTAAGDSISFGPFRLFPAARAIEKNGIPLALGNRALDILMVLVERAGEVVSHRELIARVWRGLVVDPSNLRVHMTGLRKALWLCLVTQLCLLPSWLEVLSRTNDLVLFVFSMPVRELDRSFADQRWLRPYQ